MLDTYYKMLNLAPPTVERVEFIIRQLIKFTGETPEYVFIENAIDSDGNQQAMNVVLLSETTYQEGVISGASHKFSYRPFHKDRWDDFDMVMIQEMQDMTFGDINQKSRIQINLMKGDETYAWFSAAGLNCRELLDMVKKYFWPKRSTG